MSRLLPIGTEYEYEFPLPMRSTASVANIYRYKVVAHDSVQFAPGHNKLCERVEPVGHRQRWAKNIYSDGNDAFGNVIWRADLDGEPPSPTYAEQLAKCGR